MSTKRETILVALHAYLAAAVPSLAFKRNAALKDMVEGKYLGLRDGTNELVEQYINGPIYEFTLSTGVSIVFEIGATDIDAQVDNAVDLVAVALAAADDLGGLVTEIRVLPPETAVQEIWGAADLKGADLTIEIDYWTDRSVG